MVVHLGDVGDLAALGSLDDLVRHLGLELDDALLAPCVIEGPGDGSRLGVIRAAGLDGAIDGLHARGQLVDDGHLLVFTIERLVMRPLNLERQDLADADELAVDEDVALVDVLGVLSGERRGLDVGHMTVHRRLILDSSRTLRGDLDIEGDDDVLAGGEIAQIPGEGGTGCRGALNRRFSGFAVHQGASDLVLQALTELVDDRRLRVGAVGVVELDLIGQNRLAGLDLVGMRRLGLAGDERLGGVGGHLVVADLDGGLVLDGTGHHGVIGHAHREGHHAGRTRGLIVELPGDGAVLMLTALGGADELGAVRDLIRNGYVRGDGSAALIHGVVDPVDGVDELVAHADELSVDGSLRLIDAIDGNVLGVPLVEVDVGEGRLRGVEALDLGRELASRRIVRHLDGVGELMAVVGHMGSVALDLLDGHLIGASGGEAHLAEVDGAIGLVGSRLGCWPCLAVGIPHGIERASGRRGGHLEGELTVREASAAVALEDLGHGSVLDRVGIDDDGLPVIGVGERQATLGVVGGGGECAVTVVDDGHSEVEAGLDRGDSGGELVRQLARGVADRVLRLAVLGGASLDVAVGGLIGGEFLELLKRVAQ